MSGGIPGYPQIAVAQRFAAPKSGTSDVGCYGSMGKLHRNQAVCTELPGFGFVVCFNPSKTFGFTVHWSGKQHVPFASYLHANLQPILQ